MPLNEPIFTVPEAAERYRVSPWTLWDMLRTGKIVRTKIGGKTFIRQSQLDGLVTDIRNVPPAKRASDAKIPTAQPARKPQPQRAR